MIEKPVDRVQQQIPQGARVYAQRTIYYRGVQVIHKGGRGTVVGVIGDVSYVRWDWTGETFPAESRQLRKFAA